MKLEDSSIEQTAIRTDLGAIFVSLELSTVKWVVGSIQPGRQKISKHEVKAGATDELWALFGKLQAEAVAREKKLYPVITIQEAGYDAFWVHRVLWCLMDNHVHLIVVPEREDGLRAMLGEAHRRYTRHVNFREGWRGHLFQGRFASYPMDDAHLMAAVRYVELNPVAAGMVERAEDWPWSSARSHVAGRRAANDPLTDVAALGRHVRNWRALLRHGLEAGGLGPEGEAVAEAIEARLRTGRPLAEADWIAEQEAGLGRKLAPQKPGPKARGGEGSPIGILSPEFRTNGNHVIGYLEMTRSSSNTEYVSFLLDDGGYENLHAKNVKSDVYALDNSPFYAYGVSCGDEVRTKSSDGRNLFQSVVKRGGHSTYRVRLAPQRTHADFMRAFDRLRSLGCTFEGSDKGRQRLYAIDLPPEADVAEIYSIFEDGESAGDWEFEEAHFFKGFSA